MADQPQSQSQQPKPLFPHSMTAAASSSSSNSKDEDSKQSNLPGGATTGQDGKQYVLDKDGKPCRLCTSAAAWRNLTKQSKASSTPAAATATSSTTITTTATPTQSTSKSAEPKAYGDCPPDVEALGRSTWTLLHSLTATYPETATPSQQTEMRSFLSLFSKLYPCWVCADDFRTWMSEPSGVNQPKLGGRKEFGNWMCEAHNEVNRKLGKKEFDCRFWEERWRDGWKDGRCD